MTAFTTFITDLHATLVDKAESYIVENYTADDINDPTRLTGAINAFKTFAENEAKTTVLAANEYFKNFSDPVVAEFFNKFWTGATLKSLASFAEAVQTFISSEYSKIETLIIAANEDAFIKESVIKQQGFILHLCSTQTLTKIEASIFTTDLVNWLKNYSDFESGT